MIDRLSLVSKDQIYKIKSLEIKSESTDLDFKEVFNITETKSRVEFIKDAVAFSNSKGGYLIFGVNNNFEWIGLDERSEEIIDDANICNVIDNYIDGTLDFISNTVEIDGVYFFVLYIFPTDAKCIIPFKKDGQYNKKDWKTQKQQNIAVFKSGDVYCRRGSRSIKADRLFFKLKSIGFGVIENVTKQPIMYNEFIGRQNYLQDLYLKLENKNNRIIQIDGIGGIGKTTFVHYFTSKLIENISFENKFDFIIWTSSKRNKYTPNGIKELSEFIANYKELIDEIYQFITNNSILDESEVDVLLDIEEIVLYFLTNNKVLLIVDNLETLNDVDLINFLENLPQSSKAILTTRETLGDFFLSRINLHGFEKEIEFPQFLNSQFKIFTGRDIPTFEDIYKTDSEKLYDYTKGMPLAGQLIAHQLAHGTPINIVLDNLKNGKSYEDILSFCFKGSIDKLSIAEKNLLFIFSLSEKEEYLSLDDLQYISGLSPDQIGLEGIPNLTKMSLCVQKHTESGLIGYSIPFLAKLYSKQYLSIANERVVLENYERFIEEKNKFNSKDLHVVNLFYRSKAKNHTEKVAANQALRCLTIASYDYDLAIANIEDLIKKHKRFAFLYLIKGKIEESGIYHNSYERAKKEFQIAVELDNEFLEAFIELGYLEFKSRFGNPKDAMKIVHNSIHFFEKAYSLDNNDPRVCLGLAQAHTYRSTKTSFGGNKEQKTLLARKANEFYEKSYYIGDNLNSYQIRSNAISSYNQAINYRNNIRDNIKAIEICNKGLEYEPDNIKLSKLKLELEDKIQSTYFEYDPKAYISNKLAASGWKIK
jgi:hypothetical protein